MNQINNGFSEYGTYIAQAHKSCKEIVRLVATIENDFTDMMAAFHMRMSFARFGQWINAIDNRLHRRANMRPKGLIDGLGKAGFRQRARPQG